MSVLFFVACHLFLGLQERISHPASVWRAHAFLFLDVGPITRDSPPWSNVFLSTHQPSPSDCSAASFLPPLDTSYAEFFLVSINVCVSVTSRLQSAAYQIFLPGIYFVVLALGHSLVAVYFERLTPNATSYSMQYRNFR